MVSSLLVALFAQARCEPGLQVPDSLGRASTASYLSAKIAHSKPNTPNRIVTMTNGVVFRPLSRAMKYDAISAA